MAYGGEDDVVAGQHLDPQPGVAFAGENRSRGLHHAEQRRNERSETGSADSSNSRLRLRMARVRQRRFRCPPAPRCPAAAPAPAATPALRYAGCTSPERTAPGRSARCVTKMKFASTLAKIELRARGWRHALRIHHLVANFAGPCLVEGADRGEHGGDAKHAACDLLRKSAARIEGDRKQHHHQAAKRTASERWRRASATRCGGLWRDGSRRSRSCGPSLLEFSVSHRCQR